MNTHAEPLLKSVFVIEQVEFISTLIDLALTQESIFVFTYTNIDCMHFIEDLRPDLILLDKETAGSQSQDFYKKLQLSTVSHIPVVGLGWDKDKLSFLGECPWLKGYVEKPLAPGGLKAKLTAFLKK